VKKADLERIAYEAIAAKPDKLPQFPPSVYYRFLRKLAFEMRPTLSVELGVCGGGASYHLATGHPTGKVVGIDVTIEYPTNVVFIQERCPNWTLLVGDSVHQAFRVQEYAKEFGPIGILFIDTVHTYEQTMREYAAYRPMMAPGGVICFDDLFREGMPKVWNEMPEPKIRLDSLHIGGSPTDGGFGALICE
jgi:predicted O-methyltransferase YrrM